MARFTLGSLTQEALLASEELLKKETIAEAGTPQQYEAFVKNSEQEAIEYREETKEDDDDLGGDSSGEELGTPMGDEVPEGGGQDIPPESTDDSEVEDDEDLTDTIEENPEEETETETETETKEVTETTEALDSWIRDKTKDSSSGFVRNTGEIVAGLAHLGIKYGPGVLNAMVKGTVWTFSRLGTLLFKSAEAIQFQFERAVNSTDRLEERLKNAERVIIDQLNAGKSFEGYVYKNQKVLNYLKIAGNLDIPSNLRTYSAQLTECMSSIATEFSAGNQAIQKLSQMKTSDDSINLTPYLRVDPPKRGFKPGGVSGEQVKNMWVMMFHTEPLWPGDASLVYTKPTKVDTLANAKAGYSHAKMSVVNSARASKQSVQPPQLSSGEVILIGKAAHMLVASCRDLVKIQQKMAKEEESLPNAIKRLFFSVADDEAKKGSMDELVEVVFLRAHLSSKVFVKGAASTQVHASRVLAAAVQLLEGHAKYLVSKT